MRLVDAAQPMFARHETFHPRYGWFRKAYSMTAWDPHIFTREDAPVLIGVGKNMVRAIRFWGLAAKLIVENPDSPNKRSPGLVPTRIGHALFGESGWDRYMEDPGTLWLLHWLLLAPRSRLPVWWIALNDFHAVEFDIATLETAVTVGLEATGGWANPHLSSVKKDIRALLRTYAPAEHSRRSNLDDLLDCPLRELRMIEQSAIDGRYRFTLGPKPTLPAEILTYAALDYVSRTGAGGNTVPLTRLASEPGAPGHVFKMAETDLQAALEQTAAGSDDIALAAPTGVIQLSWDADPAVVAIRVLSAYYGSETGLDVAAGLRGDEPIEGDLLDELGLGMGRDINDPLRRLSISGGAAGVVS